MNPSLITCVLWHLSRGVCLGVASALAVLGIVRAEDGEVADHWSLKPIRVGEPPSRGERSWGQNAIDAFIAAAHERDDLQPAPVADRRALARRVSFGLTGLPPSRELVDAFVADERADSKAFAAVVENLLESRHYGEHWGRHWLDVVRYADTAGENSDHPLPHVWRYRNWVIDSINSDKPYDEFVREQLAGDLVCRERVGKERDAGIIATGYLAIARRFGHDIDKEMHLTYEDAIDNLGKAFLGLSISCARCHDHKHDPITTRDYYSLYAMLESTRLSFPGCEPKQQPRDLIELPGSVDPEKRRVWEEKRDALAARLASVESVKEEKRLKALISDSQRVLSSGDVPDGGSVQVSKEPFKLTVRKGEVVQLSILPRSNYGADTTILNYEIVHQGGGETTRWSPSDLIDNLLSANPHSSTGGAWWCFLDTAGERLKLLTGSKDGVDGKKELKAWENGAPPSVLVNTGDQPVKVWTTLPARTFFCHPGPKGPVAIAWLSSVDGTVSIELTVSDGHPGGDGVAWRLDHFADPAVGQAYLNLGKSAAEEAIVRADIAAHASAEPSRNVAYGAVEGTPQRARIQVRGNHEDLGEEIPRTYLAMLGGGALGEGSSSGRLELANRIANADNPLTARVMVNRIWTWHFGRGLVATPNDFGRHGSPPSHPALLDYLANYFVEQNWSIKAMHRLILSSDTYRQAAKGAIPPESFAGFARRRMTAEELRDTLLLASGELDRSPGMGHPFPAEATWGFTQHNPFAAEYESKRRSVYLMRKRNRASRFFALFNGADPNASTPQREVTTVPTQALYFMNDPFFHDCAEKFADLILKASSHPTGRLDTACRVLFARAARDEDMKALEDFRSALGAVVGGDERAREVELWKSYARVLLGCNELLYID